MKKYILPSLALAVVAILGTWPMLPQADFYVQKSLSTQSGYVSSKLDVPDSYSDSTYETPNTLYIPSILVETPIIEGVNEKVSLAKGAWRRPNTSTPDKVGNTVLTGHRFLYTGFSKNTFYNLDKVEKGEKIIVNWSGDIYEYIVEEIKVIEPTQVGIEGDYGDTRLTLYTCHPLWTAKKRLVLVAKPV